MVGTTLSHYRVLRRLGAGGMGEVYLAFDTKLEREVALKVLPADLADSARLARLQREARAAAALNHPNIVTLYAIEEADGVPFLVMELVEGRRCAGAFRPPASSWRSCCASPCRWRMRSRRRTRGG